MRMRRVGRSVRSSRWKWMLGKSCVRNIAWRSEIELGSSMTMCAFVDIDMVCYCYIAPQAFA